MQAGYNWQFAPQWLVGIEADIQFSAAKDGVNCVLPCGTPIAFLPNILPGALFPVTFSENSVNTELNWFGTLRGRLGHVTGPVLFYVTGGLAYGEVTTKSQVSGRTSFLEFIPVNTFSGSFEGSTVQTGWTAGWGIEAQLAGNWSVKKEYLYVDLGTVSHTFNTVFNTFNPLFLGSPGDVAANRTVTTDVRHHVFRTGLNYKFGGPAVPIAPYNWTGFYIGANGGYSVGTHSTDVFTTAGPNLGIVGEGDTLYGGTQNFMLAPDGWFGGGQIGYNWQVTPQWVVGIEADLQATGAKDRIDCFLPCNVPIAITTGVASALFPVIFSEVSAESKLDWFGTLRARVGRASGPAFFYFTGGLAYGEVSSRARVAGTTTFFGFNDDEFAGSLDSRTTKVGWTWGSGLEAQLAGNWSLKTEYLYVDLGKVENTFSTIFLEGGDDGEVAATRTITTKIREHIFRAGLNYKFSDFGKSPVVTKY